MNRSAEQVDSLIASLWLGDGAVLALGSYGRSELAPYSDIDILIVHGRDADNLTQSVDQLLYPLWDQGFEVGHRVRTQQEALQATVRTDEAAAMLDARFVVGDLRLANIVCESTLAQLQRTRSKFTRGLADASDKRWTDHGACGHLLEPHLRDGSGGLRDMQVLRWLMKIWPDLQGSFSEETLQEIARGYELLLKLRATLHTQSGRRQDRLVLELQDEVASLAGYGGEQPAEEMLRDIYKTARFTASIVSDVLEDVTHSPPRRFLAFRRGTTQVTRHNNHAVRGRLDVVGATDPHTDPTAWVNAFFDLAHGDLRLSHRSFVALSNSLNGKIALDDGSAKAFEDLLLEATSSALEQMDRVGLLQALIDEWAPIHCLAQRNLYHRFSVDMHLFHTVEECNQSRHTDDDELNHHWGVVGNPVELLYACLLHDVGKGRGSDHATVGAAIASKILGQWGYDAAFIADVTFLIENHALLADAASHRDIRDAALVSALADTIATPRRLSMLYLLTRADSLATSDQAWSDFKQTLVRSLVSSIEATLAGVTTTVQQPQAWWHSFEVDPQEVVLVKFDTAATHVELAVVAPDRLGLMADVSAVLAARAVNILSAEAFTRDDGVAFELYRISPTGSELSSNRQLRIEREIRSAIVDGVVPQPAKRVSPSRGFESKVLFERSPTHTIIEVRTEDRPGVLSKLLRSLRLSEVDVSSARVVTYGIEAVDVFYVTDSATLRALSTERAKEVCDALMKVASSQ